MKAEPHKVIKFRKSRKIKLVLKPIENLKVEMLNETEKELEVIYKLHCVC